jgi:hypothetical protein
VIIFDFFLILAKGSGGSADTSLDGDKAVGRKPKPK